MTQLDKNTARKLGLSGRRSLSEEERNRKSELIQDEFIAYIKVGMCVCSYVALDDEVQTDKIIEYCWNNNIRICVPKVTDKTLKFYAIKSNEELVRSKFNLLEPNNDDEVQLNEIDLIAVPIVAFDESNNRVGFGEGFYDSVLDKVDNKIGLAFLEQKVNEIETDSWDVKVEKIIFK